MIAAFAKSSAPACAVSRADLSRDYLAFFTEQVLIPSRL
jgi:hypothetical protein